MLAQSHHLRIHLGQALKHQEQIHRCKFAVSPPLQAGAAQATAGDGRCGIGRWQGVRHGGPLGWWFFSLRFQAAERCPQTGAIQPFPSEQVIAAEMIHVSSDGREHQEVRTATATPGSWRGKLELSRRQTVIFCEFDRSRYVRLVVLVDGWETPLASALAARRLPGALRTFA